jgi:predicted glycoside hydrolase/deacetylase ChbG (UPF0249 family)
LKCLIVNADDFGFTSDVNRGIVDAHREGILTATTLMANGAAFDDAVALAHANPTLDIGCHLVLIGGNSVVDPSRALPGSIPALVAALARGELSVHAELDAQVRKILDAGLRPSHLDTHKHTHLLPPVLTVVARLSRDYRIPWVRRPFDFPLQGGSVPLSRRVLSDSLSFARGRFHRVLTAHQCRTTDHFAGFRLTGHLHTEDLVSLLGALPEGVTEFMTHPGYCTEELQAARTRLKQSRQTELAVLTAPQTRTAIAQYQIRLTNYRDLT